MNPQAYPLQWPHGWDRTLPPRQKGRFQKTLAGSLEFLQTELRLLGAKNLILSSNYTLGQSSPADPGVCAYFEFKGIHYAIPCDRWSRVEHNVAAIGLTVEAMRGMERWGAKNMIQAMFSGFKALPAAAGVAKKPWWEVLAVDRATPWPAIEANYRSLSKTRHPDAGGSVEAMTELNEAIQEARRARA